MATAQPSLFDSAPALPLQRWWRLQGQARRAGRRIEPLLVTPRFLARIDAAVCPVTRTSIGPRAGRVVALRDDASLAAGHLVTLGPAAAPVAGGRWQDAWAAAERQDAAGAVACEQALDAAAWRRLAVLRSFVQSPTPAEAATLPLLVLPPNRLRAQPGAGVAGGDHSRFARPRQSPAPDAPGHLGHRRGHAAGAATLCPDAVGASTGES